ncbi:MAG: S-layer homology domain-containing protein [Clostridia bacterium]|nr:S-layer homology domain-containing protein [Clostridia bacterium]
MTASGVINGYTDGSFKPDNSITRAEFVKILSGMLSLPNGSGDRFSDVPTDAWFAPFVYAASDYGIINGVSEDSFGPNNGITREDAAVILYRVLSKKGVTFNESLGFNDNAQISDYAKTAVGSLTAGEIIKGDNGLFRPKDSLSRAETVTMLSRISGYIK